jgi:hypothetical protein
MTKKQSAALGKSAIRFSATIHAIRTTIDGGANVTFALSGNEVVALTHLLEVRQRTGVFLEVAAVPVKERLTVIDDETKKKAKRGSTRVDRRRFAD